MNIKNELIGRTQPELSELYQNKLLRALASKNNPIVLRRYVERRIIEFVMATQTIDDQLAIIQKVAPLGPQQFSAAARHLNAEILKFSINSGNMDKVSSATTTTQVLDAYDTAVSSATTYGAGSGGKAKTRQAFKFDADAKNLLDPIATKADAAIRHRALRAEPTMLGMLQGFLGVGGDGTPVGAAPGAAAAVPPAVAQLVRPVAVQVAAATAALPDADDMAPLDSGSGLSLAVDREICC
eukprot:g5495.t1